MKITANAGEFADALALAAELSDDARIRRIQSLGAIRLTGACSSFSQHCENDLTGVEISANVLDHALTLTVPATVDASGVLALPGERLASLAAGCPRDQQIEIDADDTSARIVCGRSRFRLPVIPQDELPASLALGAETGRVELAREEALRLFAHPLFAVATDQTRYYLNGIFLHDADGGLAAAGTDGHRLCRVIVPGAAGLSQDNRLIVPRAAVKIILKLLADKSCERIVLRRSAKLFAIEAARFAFVSKLIDAEFPAYQRLILPPTGNAVTVLRAGLAMALKRVAAVIDPSVKTMRMVGLQWAPGDPALRLCVPGHDELAEDIVDAEATGAGRVAVQIHHLRELLDEFAGERIRLDTAGGGTAILVTDLNDPDVLAVQMPCRWSEQSSQAA
jgi:DNA polymerase-3 subunit beta